MFKKFLFAFFSLFLSFSVHAEQGQIINIEYVHELVKQEHGIWMDYADPSPEFRKRAANMKYVLTIVDMVNAHLNGAGWTNYGADPEYATEYAANTVAAIYCIRNLIERYHFTVTTTADTTKFQFKISAAGTYHVDWGDGTRNHYYKVNAYGVDVSHTYKTAGSYNVRIGGYSNRYGKDSAIYFWNNKYVQGISGSIGKIFPTLKDLTDSTKPMQPVFQNLFFNCTNLSGTIPPDLFVGVHGQPVAGMFTNVFSGCSKLSGTIPPNLFAKIKGRPAQEMFANTFNGCSGLSGAIPSLFSGISGDAAQGMFGSTFYGCSGLEGPIPEDLFGGIKLGRVAAPYMFNSVFRECKKLSGAIPQNLFGGPDGFTGDAAPNMFLAAFYNCVGLTEIPSGLFGYFTGDTAQAMFDATFANCTGLTEQIPSGLFGNFIGAPTEAMFHDTFLGCKNMRSTIPNKLFGSIKGVPQGRMFYGTFNGCSQLYGSIPGDLFEQIGGGTAQEMFANTFKGCSGLTGAIPSLFSGISGDAANGMFGSTFYGCSGLEGPIPEDLFGGIKLGRVAAPYMFNSVFRECKKLSGAIPQNLFGGPDGFTGDAAPNMFLAAFYNCVGLTEIPSGLFGYFTGDTAQSMFDATFYNCIGLTGQIPSGLFGNFTGAPTEAMFHDTFYGCKNMHSTIPENLFGSISGDLPFTVSNTGAISYKQCFNGMFSGCVNLTGPSARINGRYLYEIWPDAATVQVDNMYYNCTNLSDYDQIPAGWK